jgi:polyisoprenoid-binding protein YceI
MPTSGVILFFDAASHPEVTFVSKSARSTGDHDLDVLGDLTIRGITHEVTLAVLDISTPQLDMRENQRIGATATTMIRRADFGMTWNKTLDAGGVVVGELVTVSLEISLIAATSCSEKTRSGPVETANGTDRGSPP